MSHCTNYSVLLFSAWNRETDSLSGNSCQNIFKKCQKMIMVKIHGSLDLFCSWHNWNSAIRNKAWRQSCHQSRIPWYKSHSSQDSRHLISNYAVNIVGFLTLLSGKSMLCTSHKKVPNPNNPQTTWSVTYQDERDCRKSKEECLKKVTTAKHNTPNMISFVLTPYSFK